MIITDLDHLNIVSEANELQGGVSKSIFAFETLALGSKNSKSIVQVELLSVEKKGVSIAGGKGLVAVTAS